MTAPQKYEYSSVLWSKNAINYTRIYVLLGNKHAYIFYICFHQSLQASLYIFHHNTVGKQHVLFFRVIIRIIYTSVYANYLEYRTYIIVILQWNWFWMLIVRITAALRLCFWMDTTRTLWHSEATGECEIFQLLLKER